MSNISLQQENSYVAPTVERKLFCYPDSLRVSGSVIPYVITPVTLVAFFSAGVIYFNKHVFPISFPNSIIPSLSVVVGLLLVFRTNTAYDRYYEGRRLWTVIKTSVRNLVRAVYMIPHTSNSDIQEKMEAMKQIVAFTLATKHYLRDELKDRHSELDMLIPKEIRSDRFQNDLIESSNTHLPNLTSVRDFNNSEFSLNHRKVYISGYGSVNPSETSLLVDREVVSVNLPMDIIYHINHFVSAKRSANLIDPQTNNSMNAFINSLVDSLSGLERIMRTPIPLAYLIHLKQAVTLYLLFLPFTLVDLGYASVVVVVVVAFTLYGIDAIGQEIENPFGYDANDLPLDAITNEISDEVAAVIHKLSEEFRD